jgi:hypothetical protein
MKTCLSILTVLLVAAGLAVAGLTGTVSMQFGQMEPRTMEIQEGKIEGNKFSFKTVMETPNGTMTSVYEGTVEGDMLKGTSRREGGQGQGRPFEAKRVPAS